MSYVEKMQNAMKRNRALQYVAYDIANEISDKIYEMAEAEDYDYIPEGTTVKVIEAISKEMDRLQKYL